MPDQLKDSHCIETKLREDKSVWLHMSTGKNGKITCEVKLKVKVPLKFK